MASTSNSIIKGRKFDKVSRQNKQGIVIQLLDDEMPKLKSFDNPNDLLIENLLQKYRQCFQNPKNYPSPKPMIIVWCCNQNLS